MIEQTIEFANTAPKAELHMHLEGALTPELFLRFSKRNEKPSPYSTVAEIKQRYEFQDLQSFINIYLAGFSSLATTQDYIDLMDDYCSHALRENITSAEVFIETQACQFIDMELDDLMQGCIQGVANARENGLEVKLMPTFLRQLSATEALANLDALGPYYEHITAFGLAAAEVGNPPNRFKHVFDRARDMGFKLVAHAGEEGPPEYVWQALDELGVDRIDHGNRAIEDPDLVRRLARDQIPLTMCPISNLRLCVVDKLENHPLKRFMDAGVLVTVNSDDPAYFGAYLNENFAQIISALQLSQAEVQALIENSFTASFASTA